eukprot:gene2645-2945_t
MPQQQAAASLAAAAPTTSPVQPRSGTSVTPALLTMALADAGPSGAATGATQQSTEALQAVSNSQPGSQESEQLLSTTGRPRRQRRRPSQPSSPATGGAGTPSGTALTPPALSSASALVAAGRQQVQVICGSLTGWLDVTDLSVRVTVGQDERRMAPSAFEALAGKGSTRKWRQSLLVVPEGPADPWVPEPMPVGDLIKLYQLDRQAVWCDQLPGMLDLNKMQVVPQSGQFEGQPMSLSAFEQLGGRGAARKWRRSLTALDGEEAISLGEWMERYQILPGSDRAAGASPKARATTPPAPPSEAAAAAGSAAADPVNPELWMMLTEYATEYSHPEWHLHPAQVELDLADTVLSPRGGAPLAANPRGSQNTTTQATPNSANTAGAAAIESPVEAESADQPSYLQKAE